MFSLYIKNTVWNFEVYVISAYGAMKVPLFIKFIKYNLFTNIID